MAAAGSGTTCPIVVGGTLTNRPWGPGEKPGVYWNAMRIALVIVVAFLIFFFVWLAFWH